MNPNYCAWNYSSLRTANVLYVDYGVGYYVCIEMVMLVTISMLNFSQNSITT